jgi:hypothetical protein
MAYRTSLFLGLASLVLAWHSPVEANVILSFNNPSYSVGVGKTVQVQVMVSQNATGNQISTTNPLISAGIVVSFNTPSGVAAVTTITPASTTVFDSSSSSISLAQGTANLQESVFLTGTGIGTLPGLLGTFTFTGLSDGATQISVGPITPGSSFGTSNGQSFTAAQVTSATATFTVVPEPRSFLTFLTGLAGGPVLFGLLASRRKQS